MSAKCPHHVRRNHACPICARVTEEILGSELAAPNGSADGWTLINSDRTNLPTTGFVVAGSYRDGKWTTSSVSHGDGYPIWADADRTHFYLLSGPLPNPPNDQAHPTAAEREVERKKDSRI